MSCDAMPYMTSRAVLRRRISGFVISEFPRPRAGRTPRSQRCAARAARDAATSSASLTHTLEFVARGAVEDFAQGAADGHQTRKSHQQSAVRRRGPLQTPPSSHLAARRRLFLMQGGIGPDWLIADS